MPHLIRTNRQFPNHNQVGSVFEDLTVAVGSPIGPLTADQLLVMPDPMNPGKFLQYAFRFWNIAGTLGAGTSGTGTMPSGDSVATAWYVQVGGNGGGTGVTTYAFSDGQDIVLGDTPINNVTPAGDWVGGNATAVSTTIDPGPVTITAKGSVPSAAGESFSNWLQFGNGTIAGASLTVPYSGSSLAIASYGVPTSVHVLSHRLLEDLEAVLQRILVNIGDPAPGDLARIITQVARQDTIRHVEADELTDVISQLDRLDAPQIKGALLEIQGRVTRLEAAKSMLNAALKGTNR